MGSSSTPGSIAKWNFLLPVRNVFCRLLARASCQIDLECGIYSLERKRKFGMRRLLQISLLESECWVSVFFPLVSPLHMNELRAAVMNERERKHCVYFSTFQLPK